MAEGGAGFSDEFARFAAATAEWRAPGSGFSEGASFPDVERLGGISVGDFPATVELDHTTFALLDVTPTAAGAIRMNVTAPQDTVTRHRPRRPHREQPDGGHARHALPTAAVRRGRLGRAGQPGQLRAHHRGGGQRRCQPVGLRLHRLELHEGRCFVRRGARGTDLSPSTPPANTALPAISGTATDSGTLNATDGSWSG